MEYYNIITIVFENKVAALRSKESVMACLDGIDAGSYGYSEKVVFSDIFRKHLSFDNDRTFSIDEEAGCGFATPEDSLQLIPEMAKRIAEANKDIPFSISSFNTGTYSESRIELQYRDQRITVETIYYPQGDYDMLCCPECGEEILSVSEYEAGKTYTCPECGEECDLQEAYEEACPVEEKKMIDLAAE